MKTRDDIDQLEKLIGQLKAFHAEIGQLAKKSPNDGLNPFKLKMINKTLDLANSVLGADYTPFDDFEKFNSDDVPSNSDVTMIVAQYLEEAERYRSRHVKWNNHGNYVYVLGNQVTDIKAAAPTWSKK
jgi:hypothetical protein